MPQKLIAAKAAPTCAEQVPTAIGSFFLYPDAARVNRAIGRNGRFWAPGFHDHALRREENLKSVARYIVGNPLRARLVERVGDYPYWNAAWL